MYKGDPMNTIRLLVCLAALVLSACGDGGGDSTSPPVAPAPVSNEPVDVKTVQQTISPTAGGTLASDGLSLAFPAQALGRAGQTVALVTQTPASGAIASFRLAPAGARLQQPATISYTATGLPADARFFWNIDGELSLLPGTVSGDTLTTTITSLGYLPGGARQALHAPAARQQRLSAADRKHPLADPAPGGNLQIQILNCEAHASAVLGKLRATTLETTLDRALALHDELLALRNGCSQLQIQAIQQRACDKLSVATSNASVIAADSFSTFQDLAVSLFAATSMAQAAGATCASGEQDTAPLIESKFDQFLTFVEARMARSGFADEATQRDLRVLFSLDAQCQILGMTTACQRFATVLYPRLLDIMRKSAFDSCLISGAQPLTQLQEMGAPFSTRKDPFYGYAGYSMADLEQDAVYCTNPQLNMSVFENATTLPEEITSSAATLRALGTQGSYITQGSITVPAGGSLNMTGQIRALRCADGTQSNDELVFRLNGRELVRHARQGEGYTITNQALDFVPPRDLARLGLAADLGAATLTLEREGAGCTEADPITFSSPLTLFTIIVTLGARSDQVFRGTVSLSGTWDLNSLGDEDSRGQIANRRTISTLLASVTVEIYLGTLKPTRFLSKSATLSGTIESASLGGAEQTNGCFSRSFFGGSSTFTGASSGLDPSDGVFLDVNGNFYTVGLVRVSGLTRSIGETLTGRIPFKDEICPTLAPLVSTPFDRSEPGDLMPIRGGVVSTGTVVVESDGSKTLSGSETFDKTVETPALFPFIQQVNTIRYTLTWNLTNR